MAGGQTFENETFPCPCLEHQEYSKTKLSIYCRPLVPFHRALSCQKLLLTSGSGKRSMVTSCFGTSRDCQYHHSRSCPRSPELKSEHWRAKSTVTISSAGKRARAAHESSTVTMSAVTLTPNVTSTTFSFQVAGYPESQSESVAQGGMGGVEGVIEF